MKKSKLALFGGNKAVTDSPEDIFRWPVITREDEEAVLEVLRRGGMSGTDVTKKFEKEFAEWQGVKYCLGHNTGTAALQAAMYGCGVGVGDEIISPSLTYWATCLPAFSLGASVVFSDVEPDTLCMDPGDIEHRITAKTKAIAVVHYLGHPADMAPIMKVARKHGLKVIEDVSHAQGGLYKGRKVGTFGDAAAMSLMSGKSFAVGEAGMLATDDLEIYERALAFGHYERFKEDLKTKYLKPVSGLPLGGYKYRMHQLSAAVGRVQLKHYDRRCAEIRKAMNYFWDLLDGVPGLRAHRTPKRSRSNMGGWYAAKGLYRPEEIGGLSVTRFTEAVRAEGFTGCTPGCNRPLHLHPLFNDFDVYGHGRPTRLAFSYRELRQGPGSLPATEAAGRRTYTIPWFKKYEPEVIARYAEAFRKAAENYRVLLKDDKGDPEQVGAMHLFSGR